MSKEIIRDLAYPAIDGVRFYAAMVVLVQHTIGGAMTEYYTVPASDFTTHSANAGFRFLAYVADGNHGVDVFFLISGFLMARIVLSGRDFSYVEFIWSRFLRIYPAFLVSLIAATLLACLVFGWPWSPIDFTKDLAFLNAIPGYVQYPYNHVSWSLGYEFAFYLIVPALLLFSRLLDRRMVAFIAALACAVLIPNAYARLFGLFAGAFIGAMSDGQLRSIAKRIPLIPAFAAFVGMGLAKAGLELERAYYYYPLVVVALLLLIKIVWDPDHELHRFFSHPALRWLGTLSYSIYLYHAMLASLVLRTLVPRPASAWGVVWYAIVTVALTIGVAYLSYTLIEKRYFVRRSRHAVVATTEESPATP